MQVDTISQQIFFTTIRIDTISVDGSQGSGTGFIVNHDLSENNSAYFIVTNKHVIANTNEGIFTFIKAKDGTPALGDGFRLHLDHNNWSRMWFGHPDPDVDIAICALIPLLEFGKLNHGIDVFFRSINTAIIPSEEQIADLDALESIIFIGYPNGVWDSKNLLPVARRGTTASPIEVDFEGTPRFLIDASVFSGSSGSPVFLLNEGSYAAKGGGLVAGSRFYFLGVVAAVFYRTQFNQIIAVPIPTQVKSMVEQREMIDLGIVFKARTVVETINAFLAAHNAGQVAPAG